MEEGGHNGHLTQTVLRGRFAGHGTVGYRRDIAAAVTSLPLRQFWLTAWEADAPAYLSGILPRTEDYLTASTEEHGWWKIDAVVDFPAANPDVRRVIWVDDELAGEDPILGIPLLDMAADAFEGTETLLLSPDPDEGMTGAHLSRIDAFLDGASGPLQDVAPDLLEDLIEDGLDGRAETFPAPPATLPGGHRGDVQEVADPFADDVPKPLVNRSEQADGHHDEDPFGAPAKTRRKVTVPDDDLFG
jgi:hypothetical protein